MAIKINNTTVIDDGRNFSGVGVTITGSVTAGGTTGTSGQVLQSTGTGVTWATVSAGGADDGSAFNTGITSAFSAILTGIGDTILTLPSTVGEEYIIYSIHAANVGLNTEVNVIGAFDFNGGERSYFAYNIPIPTGMAVELLQQPQVLNPSDKIVMRSTDYDRVGINTAVQVYITYHQKTATDYFGRGFGQAGINTIAPIGIYTATTYPSILQSIRLTNTTDLGGYPISVTVTSGVTTRSLVEDLIVPKYASIELLETPKRLNTNDVLKIQVDQLSTIDVQISGKVKTS
jgi:hypothetical protein